MNTLYGWGVAAVIIVGVSWFFYRYFAPKNWKEWAGAGIVQAFIIAFYAEMYGFPLTMYLLARFFNLEVSSANLWSQLFGWGEFPMTIAMILGYTFVIIGVAMIIEGWREIYYARRQGYLATRGLYGVVRHPQYTGIFLAIFGEGIVHWPTIFSVILFPIIVLVYVLLARKEEKEMLAKFGEQYRAYQKRVPMFFSRRWSHLFQEVGTGENDEGRK